MRITLENIHPEETLGVSELLQTFPYDSMWINHSMELAENIIIYKTSKGDLVIRKEKEDFLLTSDTPIIIPSDPTHYTKEAANFLATYINKVVGITPQILTGFPNPVPTKAIWVGYQNGIEKFFPGADLSFAFPEEMVNVGNENYILISGRDLYDPKKSNFPDAFGRETIANVQQEYGTCNAVFTFLQDQLNIRWLWPGELGEDIIKTESLNIKPFYYRHHPKILDRSGILYRIGLYVHKHTKAEQEWGVSLSALN